MDYVTLAEIAEKWGISNRRVQTLCSEGRIPGATRLGNMWVVPINSEKPKDARIKNGNYIGMSTKIRKNLE